MADEKAVTNTDDDAAAAAAAEAGKGQEADAADKGQDAGDQGKDKGQEGGKDAKEGKDAASLLTEDDGSEESARAPADWPEDWRAKLAGDDKKYLKQLDRYASPQDVFKKLKALEQKVSSGELKSTEKPEDEKKLAAWRKERGVPEAAEKYVDGIKLKDGRQIGEEDMPLLGKVLSAAHGRDLPQDVVNDMVASYYEGLDEIEAQKVEANTEAMEKAQDELRGEWGGEYRANINAVKSFLDGLDDDLKNDILSARTPDGVEFLNARTLRFFHGVAKEQGFNDITLPSGGGDRMSSIDGRLKEIKALRTGETAKRDYWGDEKVLQEERDLLAAKEKIEAKAA